MACTTLNPGQIQLSAAAVGRFEVFYGEEFQLLPNYHYINAPIKPEVEKKIISAVRALRPQGSGCVLVQIWVPTKINSKIHLLTITGQAFALYGYNQEFEEYHRGSFHQKLYVYEDSKGGKGAAFGLPGLAFLNRAHEQTQNMHNYPEDQRPPCEVFIFERIWGSYVVPVFVADKCVCVLEFVTDKIKDSYNDDILAIYRALQDASLQSSIQINRPRNLEMISGQERDRRTDTSDVTKYCCLVPYMGLSKSIARKSLGLASAANKEIKESTFRNIRENVGLPEWPCKRVKKVRATSVQTHQTYATPSADLTQGNNAEDTDIMDVVRNYMESEDGMDIDHPNADMDLTAYNNIWDISAHEIGTNPEASIEGFPPVNEDIDVNDYLKLDDWVYDETK